MTRPPVVVIDDMMDAVSYAMQAMPKFKAAIDIETGVSSIMNYAKCPASPTGRAMTAQMAGKSIVQQQWAKAVAAQINKPSIFHPMFNGGFISRLPDEFTAMRAALKATKSGHLARWNQMNRAKRQVFINRVERYGQKDHSSQNHMQKIYIAFIAEKVFAELKD